MTDEAWTTRSLIRWMAGHFESKDVEAPRVVAEMLLSHVIGCDRMRLYMEADRSATTVERETLRALVKRAADHEPVQYLVGRAAFFGMELAVDDSTLIPQPCTEDLVTIALEHLGARTQPGAARVADVGTGSGCIAVAIAKHAGDVAVLATDVEPRALELAEHNARRAGVADRIDFVLGDGPQPLAERAPLDVIVSNPPYIPDREWNDPDAVQRTVREFVPERATRGGADGLHVIRPLVREAPALLGPGGLLALEIADCLRDDVLALAQATDGLEDVDVRKDSESYWRFLVARRA